jgi:Bacterial sugar transferase
MTDTYNHLADNDPQGESPKASQPDKSPSKSNAVSKNLGNKHALRHCVYSYALLPWESREDFQALHQSFRNDLKPRGADVEAPASFSSNFASCIRHSTAHTRRSALVVDRSPPSAIAGLMLPQLFNALVGEMSLIGPRPPARGPADEQQSAPFGLV